MAELTELKKTLKEALESDELDFDKIHSISQQIVALDDKAVRFSIDARHVHRLGFELVGKQETALSELIKNAYDADATNVNIDFKNYATPGGSLVIKDDGHGMDEEVVRNAWMRLSTQDKEISPVSPIYGRSKAGRKGIGRFAVERLGKNLILETKVFGQANGLRVQFNWDKDFVHGRDLNQISYKLERFPKQPEETGTKLIINDLRDRWLEKVFEKVWKSVLLLQPPFKPTQRFRAQNIALEGFRPDPGFKVYINGRVGDVVVKELSIEKNFLNHGIAKIKGRIDAFGNGEFFVNSLKLNLDDRQQAEEKYLLSGMLEFEAIYFIYDSALMTGISVTTASEMGRKYGGIRVYRDGFRVLPYGEPYDDWLKLAFDTARRHLIIAANNYHFFGHIELSSYNNPLFEETSSREGLIENEAFEELQRFIRACIEWAVLRVASSRSRKTTAGQKDFTSEWRKPSDKTSELIANIIVDVVGKDTAIPEVQKSKTLEKLQEIKQEQENFEAQVDLREKEHVQYEAMLRILASLGISRAVFSHEIRGALTGVDSSIGQLFDHLEVRKDLSESKKFINLREDLESSVDRLKDVSRYIADLISHSSSREKDNQALHSVINNFVTQFENYFNARGIKFETEIKPTFLRTEPIHRSEIDSVLFNFLTNSVKSMDRSGSQTRKIKITAKRFDMLAVISFQDTGSGVPSEIADKIFDAFYTTSHYKGDEIAGPGSGLGLKIVSDIAEANGGYVRLAEPEPGFGCRFDFAVPLSKEQV